MTILFIKESKQPKFFSNIFRILLIDKKSHLLVKPLKCEFHYYYLFIDLLTINLLLSIKKSVKQIYITIEFFIII
ncbi:hypothetical protein BpHYR1_053574 [Brachionus plicatilis]|uniref:Uncharacterized protein n=1 Tax=Brachionus plicatilis TaxID=10195 RepID=A0A3M7QYB3_BRAPC|nr:hypothetical protein BpHYR1_053574 [Brachionus plicatilis]